MSGLVVGGIPIKISGSGISRPRFDGVDRARAFDQTYRASATGTAKREWVFSTPPVTRGQVDYYESVLLVVTPQLCSGDVLGNNQLPGSDQFSHAVWTKFNASISAGITDQDGITPAYTMTATGGSAFIQQTLAVGASLVRTNSIYVRRRTGTGTVQLRAPDASTITALTLTSSWARFQLAGAASVNRDFVLFVNTSGDAVDISDAQLEDSAVASTYNSTSASVAPLSCCTEITGWTPVRTSDGYRVVGEFTLHEV